MDDDREAPGTGVNRSVGSISCTAVVLEDVGPRRRYDVDEIRSDPFPSAHTPSRSLPNRSAIPTDMCRRGSEWHR
jgi:hypothetical protein